MKSKFCSISMIFISLVFSLLTISIQAQSIIPISKRIKTANISSFDSLGAKKQFEFTKLGDNQEVKKTYLDSIQNSHNDSIVRLTQKYIDTLNETSTFDPVIGGGVSNIENFSKAYGSLSVGLVFRMSKYRLTKNNWIDPHFVYVMFNARTAASSDSSQIQKSLLFPELGKRDFVIGYYHTISKNGWTLKPVFELSLNRFEDTATKRRFLSQSFLLGFQVHKDFTSSTSNTSSFLNLFPYYSIITVDRKFNKDYVGLTSEEHIHSTFHTVGLRTSIQIQQGILFCNMKYIMNSGKNIVSSELVRFIYTIGTQFFL